MNQLADIIRKCRLRMYEADHNSRYFGELLARYERRDLVARLVLGIMAIAAAVSKLTGGIDLSVMGAIAGLVATNVIPVFGWPGKIAQLELERDQWIALRQQYENAFTTYRLDRDAAALRKAYERIRKLENTAELKRCKVPEDRKLKERIFDEVVAAHQSDESVVPAPEPAKAGGEG